MNKQWEHEVTEQRSHGRPKIEILYFVRTNHAHLKITCHIGKYYRYRVKAGYSVCVNSMNVNTESKKM